MKKAILFVLALILLSVVTNAQSAKAFDENTKLVNVGVGLGLNYYGFTKNANAVYRRTPVICLSYEQPFKKRLGPGFLGIGAFASFQHSSYKYTDNYWANNEKYYYQHRYTNFVGAARAAYHWDGLNAENAEVYGGAIAGLRIQTYSYSSDYPGNNDYYRSSNSGGVYPVISVFAGARWYFVKKVAVYGELSGGSGIPWATGGLTFKL